MKYLLTLVILCSFNLPSYSQPPTETIGTPTGSVSVSKYTGWTNQGVLTFSGNAEVQNTEPSNNRLGSGGGNIFFTNKAGTYFEMSGFDSIQPDDIEIIFGMYNYDTTNLKELLLEYSTDGINYFQLPYKRYLAELYQPTPWTSMQANILKKINVRNLHLRFTQTLSTKQFRIDDIFLRYYFALAIKLQEFTSSLHKNSVSLSWKASSDSRNETFSVEKSSDGTNFTTLQEQSAKGSGTFNYLFTDPSPLSASVYYRLKMRSQDGSDSYSKILHVQPKLAENNILQNVYPLPAKSRLNIQIQSSKTEKAEISVTDISGKKLITNSISLTAGINNSVINVQSLNKGVYFLKVVTSQTTEIRKIVVEQ